MIYYIKPNLLLNGNTSAKLILSFQKVNFSRSIIQVLNTLITLNKINFANPKKPKIPAECFYVEELSSHVDIASDYIAWLSDQDVSS